MGRTNLPSNSPSASIVRTEDDALSLLYQALDGLRRSEDPMAPHHAPAWATVRAWIRGRGRGPDAEDIEQETLFAVMRNVQRMTAEVPLAAAKWISTILRHKHIDQIRTRNVDALDHGLVHSAAHDPLESVQADNEERATPEMLEDRYGRIEEAILHFVEESESRPNLRLTQRAQGRAAFYRLVRELDSDDVEAAIGFPEPIGKDRLYKWIERGREVVTQAMDAWVVRAPNDEEIAAIRDVVVETMRARRADAGQPRPERRKR